MKITREIYGYTYTTELTPAEIKMAYEVHQMELDRKYIDQYIADSHLFENLADEDYYKIVELIRKESKALQEKYSLSQEAAVESAVIIAQHYLLAQKGVNK